MVLIRKALVTDGTRIHQLAATRALASGAVDRGSDSGFLVSNLSEQEYVRWILHSPYVAVACGEQDELLGFILAYPAKMIDANDHFNLAVRATICSEVEPSCLVIVKQVAVHARRAGVGTRLYSYLRTAVPSSTLFVGAIVEDPPNLASMAFHRAQGGKRIGELMHGDGRLRGIWMFGAGASSSSN